MESKNGTIVFAAFLAQFIFLLSYNIALHNHTFNEEQRDVIRYLQNDEALDEGFTQREAEHLAEVKNVMNGVNILFEILAIIIVVLAVYLYKHDMLGKGLFWGGMAGGAAAVVVIFISAVNFSGLFTQFHRPLFEAGSWLFSPEDALIQLFPLSFFIQMTKSILTITLLLNGAVFGTGWILMRKRT